MPRIIHRVFVSSTYEDLREERAEVQKALLMLDCFPVGMELFTADDGETWEFIKRQITESDYYVVIVAGRYGSMAPDGISFTEKEYDYAREIGKPTIAFLHGDIENLPSRFVESNPVVREKLEAFKRKIKPHPVRFFTTPHQLATEVLASVVKLRDSHPASGFVRADEAADLSKYSRLLEENVQLRAEIDKARPPTIFEGAGLTFDLLISIMREGSSERVTIGREITRGEAFLLIANELVAGNPAEANLVRAIGNQLAPEGAGGDAEILNFGNILQTLYAFGLIAYEQKQDERNRPIWDNLAFAAQGPKHYDVVHVPVRFWKLTEFGQTQYGALTARQNT